MVILNPVDPDLGIFHPQKGARLPFVLKTLRSHLAFQKKAVERNPKCS